jgi:hypothetical protein
MIREVASGLGETGANCNHLGEGPNSVKIVRFEVFTAVTMKNGVFWDVTPFASCKN